MNQTELWAQIVIKGKVVDSKLLEPLVGAVVNYNNTGTATNINGEFELDLPSQTTFPLTLTVKLVGYHATKLVLKDNKFIEVKLAENSQILNQVIISAQRNEVNVLRASSSTEIIKPYLIENKITTNLNKVVDQIPSVNVVDGQINIRSGSGWSYGAGSRVMVLLDGMPFLSGDAGQVPWKFLPIENIEQIEVLKGASSVLYGSSALNGIVSLKTIQATNKPITKVNVFSGVFSEPKRKSLIYKDRANTQKGFNAFHARKFGSEKNNSFTLAANYLNDEGYRLGEFDNRLRLNYKLDFKGKKNKLTNYGLGGGFLATEGASFLLWQNFENGYTILNKEITVTKSTNVYVDPTVSFYTGKLKHDIKSRWFYIKNDVNNPTQNQDNSFNTFYLDYQLSDYLTKAKLAWVYGVTGVYTISKSPLYNGDNFSKNSAIFLNIEKHFFKADKLRLNAGVRYEYFNLNNTVEGKPVVRLGSNYQLAKYTFLRASYGQGYRFPSIAEQYVKTSVGALNIFQNPNLRSETGSSIEVGIKQAFSFKGVKGFIDAAYYDTHFNDMIEFNFGSWGISDPNPFMNLGFKSVNVGKARINGADFSLSAEGYIGNVLVQTIMGYTYANPIVANIDYAFATDSANTQYSFRNTRSDSNNVLKYRFNHLAKMDVQLSYKKFKAGFSLRYNSYMQNIDAAFIYLHPLIADIAKGRETSKNGNLIADLRFGYAIKPTINIGMAVSNLLNAEVITRPADIGPPRLVMFNAGFSF